MDDPVVELARKRFGIPYLYPYQRLVMANILDAAEDTAAEDTAAARSDEPDKPDRVRQVVILPTGAGKSLCFQLPSLLCPGPTLVVYPLLGLMSDQLRSLERRGIGATLLRGGQEPTERSAALEAVRSRSTPLIIANPEILAAPAVAEALAGAGIFHFVIDEAHSVAEWGDTFRPSYLELGRIAERIAPRVVTAFTATASPPVLGRLAEVLFGGVPYRLVMGSADRPNIRYEVRPALSMFRELRRAVAESEKPLIVFVASRTGSQLLAERLRDDMPGLDTRFYHAGLSSPERAAMERWFMDSTDGVLCATCAYGMGMDKPNVRTVIHYGPSSSPEAYAQESGRAGRDGQPAAAVLIREALPSDYRGSDDRGDGSGDTIGPANESAAGLATGPTTGAAGRKALMAAYAASTTGCRRAFLLRVLTGDPAVSTACSGCDACDGTAMARAPGSAELGTLVRSHPRRFDRDGAADLLTEGHGRGLPVLREALDGWSAEEAVEAIARADKSGLVRVIGRGPWKGRLTVGKPASGWACRRAGSSRSTWWAPAREPVWPSCGVSGAGDAGRHVP